MNTSFSCRGYSLVKQELSNSETNDLKKILTVKPFVHKNYAGNNNPFPVYAESKKKIYLPRFFGIDKYGEPLNYKLGTPLEVNLNFGKSLRPIQEPIVEAYLNNVNDTTGGGGIIAIPCGYGKTVIGLYIACKLKLKTLIVVHKEFLLNQWKERINEFVPDIRVGRLQGSVIKVNNCEIVIGMLQSISMKDYEEDVFKDFGLVIFDECHHLGAEVFSKALLKTNFKYTLGLSATPRRDDGLTKVFEWYLGKIVYQIKKRNKEDVSVKIIKYFNEDEEYCKEEKNFKGLNNSSKMINNICSFIPRTEVIVNELGELHKENRKILVLSNRVSHLKDIHILLTKINIDKVGYYIGGMKEKELDESTKNDIILATFSMAEEGFDCKELDSVIFASPRSKIEQAVGRILRKKVEDRVVTPKVIDIADEFSMFINQNTKRFKFYKKNKYEIVFENHTPFPDNDEYEEKQKTNKLPTDLEFLD